MNSLRGWSAFLERFPDSRFASLAQSNREALGRSENIAVANLQTDGHGRGAEQDKLA